MNELLQKRLEARHKNGLYRELFLQDGVDFASNDYLGFARCEELKQNILEAWGHLSSIGSTGSRLLTGNSTFCEQLEDEIARFAQAETALLFSSGYMANIGVITALARRENTILYDEDVHASMRDGIVLSKARNYAWRHNDLNHLEELLRKNNPAVVLAESIYSTDGSRGPHGLYLLCEKYNSLLVVDEAHSFGIFPPQQAHAHIFPFGKALGCAGAAVCGSNLLRQTMINFARSFIYTTNLPFYTLVAIREAVKKLKKENHAVTRLHTLLAYAKKETPIWQLKIKEAKKRASHMSSCGYLVNALLPPTTREECLRITLHTFNTQEEYDELCHHLL